MSSNLLGYIIRKKKKKEIGSIKPIKICGKIYYATWQRWKFKYPSTCWSSFPKSSERPTKVSKVPT